MSISFIDFKITNMNISINKILVAIIILFISSCDSGPKVISEEKEKNSSPKSTGIFSGNAPASENMQNSASITEDMHTVIAKKVMQSTKYVYVYVQEGEEEFWIATTKQEIKVGSSYFYRGGFLKTNFESKEHNKVFDKIYLVTKLVSSDHGASGTAAVDDMGSMNTNGSEVATMSTGSGPAKKIEVKGSITIAELFANPKKYSGKNIQVSGECVKLNSNIMGRNWIHLNDGSTKKHDVVITSDTPVPIGKTVTMVGMVVLDKDFGSGYRYDILLENGAVVQ